MPLVYVFTVNGSIVGVIVSTVQNPTSFNNFSQAVPFFQTTGEGPACFPLNLASSGVNGLNNGVNATLQFVFDGGDGTLYQVGPPPLSLVVSFSLSIIVRRRHSKQLRYHRVRRVLH